MYSSAQHIQYIYTALRWGGNIASGRADRRNIARRRSRGESKGARARCARWCRVQCVASSAKERCQGSPCRHVVRALPCAFIIVYPLIHSPCRRARCSAHTPFPFAKARLFVLLLYYTLCICVASISARASEFEPAHTALCARASFTRGSSPARAPTPHRAAAAPRAR